MLGLVEAFNFLPTAVVEGSKTVQSFQAQLQELVLVAAKEGVQNWKALLGAGQASWERRELKRLKDWTSRRT